MSEQNPASRPTLKVIGAVMILAISVALAVLVIAVDRVKDRDAVRQNDIKQFVQAVEDFKQDFGFYPNYTMTLGLGKDKSKLLNFDLASPISICDNYQEWMVNADLTKPEKNVNAAKLKPGFQAVSQFLVCLGYLSQVSHDPLWQGTGADYHYRVSYDYQSMIAEATQEAGGVFQLPANNDSWQLTEESDSQDKLSYQAFGTRETANSRYLYQCLASADGKKLSPINRSKKKYAPFIKNDQGNFTANPACEDKLESLLIVGSR